ncbi:hypothetical protein EVU94_06925 [Flavobacteriaceae bacterium 144Ye]|nr:hypothetical protein EVU94_06925 [Flavobacteriaceae bacterium 144Ye]
MKKNLLLITTLLFTSIVSAQWTEIAEIAEKRNKPEEYYEYYENGNVKLKAFKDKNTKDGEIVLTGEYIIYYEDGTINVKGNFVNTKKDGDIYYYNENGVLTDIENFTLGDINTSKHYYQNGQLESEEYYMYDIKLRVKRYYSNGNLHYDQQSTNHPTNTIYYENGEKKAQGSFKMDGKGEFITDENERLIKIGEWKYYDENGNLTLKETYKFGKLVSSEKVEEKRDDYDDMFYWSDSSISKEDINNTLKELTSVRNLQLVSIDEIKNNSGYFGGNNSTTHSFKIKTDESTRKLFASIRYEADKVYYNGRYYYDVLYDVQIIFDDVYEVYQNGDKIEFVFYEDYGFLRRAKPQGEYWSDYVKNEFNFSITIYDDDIREETLKHFKYLVENPIMKRE